MNEYEKLRRKGVVGFAEIHLVRCYKESKTEDITDIEIYKQLVQLDEKLGTTWTEQLYSCLFHTTRLDIIKL